MRFVRKDILKSMVIKEFRQLFRDKRMLMPLFAAPVMMLFVLGYAVNLDVREIRMAVLDENGSSESRDFIRTFTGSGYFLPVAYLESGKELSRLMDSNKVDVFLHIKRDFSGRIKSGKGTEVQLILDGTDSNRAAVITAYVNQIAADFSLEYFRDRVRMLVLSRGAGGMRMKENVTVNERALFNPDLASRNFFLPGVIGLLVALITIMLTSMSIVKERESGTMEQIIVSPIRPLEYIAGKTLPFAIVGFIDIIVVTVIAIAWFGVPFNGSFLFLLFSGLLYILSTLAVGLYISTVSRTQQQAMLSSFIFFLPAILFSGFMFPIYAMPVSIQAVTFLNPMRYFMTIIRGVFLKGVGIGTLWPEMLALLFIGAVLMLLSVRRFARRME